MVNINLLKDSWCIKNDGSEQFKDNVLKWVNKTFNQHFGGSRTNAYYGIDHSNREKEPIVKVIPFAQVLTIDEFITLSTEQQQIQVPEKEMPKGKIKSIHVFLDNFARASVEHADKTVIEITIPSEALAGLSLEERTTKIMERAKCHLDSICVVNEIK